MALAVEVAELLEIFQWMTDLESRSPSRATLNHIKDEIGDVQIYLTMIADKFDLCPIEAAKIVRVSTLQGSALTKSINIIPAITDPPGVSKTRYSGFPLIHLSDNSNEACAVVSKLISEDIDT